VGAVVGIVAAIFVVVIAVGCVVYNAGKDKKAPLPVDRYGNAYGRRASRQSDASYGVSPAFTPHIARGQTSQRYSGSAAPGGRRSFGNHVEMSIYSAGYGDSSDSHSVSSNPHFASPRLANSRKSIDGRQSIDGRRSSSGSIRLSHAR
jgi:hypothetical protein